MNYRRLGSSELRVSEISLGSWLTFGTRIDRETTAACVREAFDCGINLFDTANMYGRGAAESLWGEILSDYPRSKYLLATKVYFPMSDKDRGLSRKQILKQADASLVRLRTEYLDLYQCHRFDEEVPLEETMGALEELVDAGKVRYLGVSHWKPAQIREAKRLDERDRLVSHQPQYSMLHRSAARRVFPVCEQLGIGQIVHSPLAQGVLTGKYQPNEPPPEGSRGADPELSRRSGRLGNPSVLAQVQGLQIVASRLDVSMAQLAIAWVLRDKRVASAIIGATRAAQIRDNAGATEVNIEEEIMEEIDSILGKAIRT